MIEGAITITPDGGDPVHIGPGDAFRRREDLRRHVEDREGGLQALQHQAEVGSLALSTQPDWRPIYVRRETLVFDGTRPCARCAGATQLCATRSKRVVTYLRVSVTDRCDLRCVYCMASGMTFMPKRDLLTLEELDRVATAFVARGVRKLRLTGGEPLVRRGVTDLLTSLSRHLLSGRFRS